MFLVIMYIIVFDSASTGGSETTYYSTGKVYLQASEFNILNKVKLVRDPSTAHEA